MPEAPSPDRHLPVPVLAEGEGWIVVAKPPRVVVHRNAGQRRASAMLQRVRDMVGRHVYLVHRLDWGASGCLLLATQRELAGPLSAALNGPTARKTYLAFVRGRFPHEEPVRVETPIKTEFGFKEAASVVELLGRSQEPRCSLLRVRPETGRNHQVRRHVRDLHHPIIHDAEHGDSRINRHWRENHGVFRLGLHALRLELDLPGGGRLDVVSPLFADQAALYPTLPWWEEALGREPALGLPPLPLDPGDPGPDPGDPEPDEGEE